MYEKYGGYKHVFAKHYRRMYYDWILPVWIRPMQSSKRTRPQFAGLKSMIGVGLLRVTPCKPLIRARSSWGWTGWPVPAHYLQKAGSNYVMLEKADAVGTTWTTQRWDSFRLVTENSLCMMPDFPCTEIGEPVDGFMPRDTITAYLQAFCKRNNLRVRLGDGAEAVTKGWGGTWMVKTTRSNWIRAQNVVMACSGFHVQISTFC